MSESHVLEKNKDQLQLVQSTPTGTVGLDSPDIPEAFEVWPKMIAEARERLDICQFYIISKKLTDPGAQDGRLAPILDLIVERATAGVAVRIVIDSKFGEEYAEDWKRLASTDGIEVRQIEFEKLTGGIQHSKYFVVDNSQAYVGSQNFDWRSLEHVVELGVRITEPTLIKSIRDVFDTDWAIAGGDPDYRKPIEAHDYDFPIASTFMNESISVWPAFSPKGWLPHEDSWDLPKIIDLIDKSTDRIRIQLMSYAITGYQNPEYWEEIDNALRRAATRDVDVRLLIGDWTKRNEKKLASIISLHAFPNITVRMVTIPRAAEGEIPFARVIHSKFLTSDAKQSWIGTSNWARGYFYSSRNLGLVIEGQSFASQLESVFDRLWSSTYSYEVMAGPLRDVLNKIKICRDNGETPIVIFDLDDTLFSTRERTFRIMQEFGKDRAEQFPTFQHVLNSVRPDDVRYGIGPTLANIGVEDAALEEVLKAYWWKRFFLDEYVAYDLPNPGAVEFVNQCFDNGAVIYYCTGRHFRSSGRRDSNRSGENAVAPAEGMERGTIKALLDRGFPLASGRAILHLKSSFHQSDVEFKHKDALPKIRALNGKVIATFENEPENANIFLESFPDAMHFWLQTQHKPDAQPANPHLIKIYDFFTNDAS